MRTLDRLVASLAFGFIYTLVYSGPFIVLWFVLGSPDNAAGVVLGVFGIAGFVLASYRTKYAVDAWAFEDMTFREAHRTSWAMVRTNLSFLPFVGRFFRNPKDGTFHNRPLLYVIIVVVAIVITGMAWHFFQLKGVDNGWHYISNDDDSARWWVSPDDMRSLIVDRTSNEAHYFDNTPGHLCFTYSVTGIPGEWLPVPGHDGLFSVGSNVYIGVGVYHRDGLPGPVEEPILNRAAALLERTYRESYGPVSVTLTPFQPVKLKAIKWEATCEVIVGGESVQVEATKILVEYGPEWVVQISADGAADNSFIFDQIVNSFCTTHDSNCFWTEIGRMLADIGGFSDAPTGARAR